MQFKINYAVNGKMSYPSLSNTRLDGVVGARFDEFIDKRVAGRFAIHEILREAEECFRDQFDDEYAHGMWRSEFWGKLMLSAVQVCHMKGDEQLKSDIKASCYTMLSYQSEDGYLSAYKNGEFILPCNPEHAFIEMDWECNYNWNVWGQKYTLWALLEAAVLLDDEKVLDGARKLADRLIAQIKRMNIKITEAGVMHGMAAGSIMKPMLMLYRLTGNADYLTLALETAAEWEREDGAMPNLITNALSGIPVSKWYTAEEGWYAKAYEMMSCYEGLIELYKITGNEKFFNAVSAFWDVVCKHETNVLGSAGYCERFADAKDYIDAATEICDVIHWMRLCRELFALTGDMKYIEAFEKAFLNAFLAGVFEGGSGAFFVRSAGRHWNAEPHCDTKYQNCCLDNVPRAFATAAEMIMTKNEDGYFVNAYIQSLVRFDDASFRISSGAIDRARAAITVRGAKAGDRLYLRIPEWSDGINIVYNLEKQSFEGSGKYVSLDISESDTHVIVYFHPKTEVVTPDCDYAELAPDDYHRRRWCDAGGFPCGREQMVYKKMCVVKHGPLLLARSKKLGASSAEMFSNETVCGRAISVKAIPARHDRLLAAFRVSIETEDGVKEYFMCDFASAANLELNDPEYFTIYV